MGSCSKFISGLITWMIYPHFPTPKAHTIFFRWNWSWLTVRRRTNNRLLFTTTTRLDVFIAIAQFNLKGQCHAFCNRFKELKHVNSNSHGSVSWFKTLLSAIKLFACCLLLRMARMDIWIKTWRNWADFFKCKKFIFFLMKFVLYLFQAPAVQKVDNAIHQLNHYSLDSTIGFPNTLIFQRCTSRLYFKPSFI